MKTQCTMNSRTWFGTVAVLLLAVLAVGYSLPVSTIAAAPDEKSADDGESKMMCPMMAGMKDLKLHADSPPLLAARADVLKLSEAQQAKLKAIAETAREQAREVLTPEQREQLGDSGKAMGMMDIAKMRMKEKKSDGSSKMMCPMCMKMMKDKMKNGSEASDSKDRSN